MSIFESTEEWKQIYWKASSVGLSVIFVQLGVATIPFELYNDWGIFLITIAGHLNGGQKTLPVDQAGHSADKSG